MLQPSDMNVQALNIEPYILIVDESSINNFYIGTSRSFKNPSQANWRIKRIWKVGTVWKIGFPNGNQDFTFVWDDRTSYIYE
jgi:hypothetical protein